MAQREASVKLTLNNSQFLAGMKRAGDSLRRMGVTGKNAAKHLKAGLAGAKKELGGLASAAKRGVTAIATLGGAFSAGAALKNAVQLNSTYSTLAFRVQTATGAMTKSADIQQIVERSASKTTRTSEEMATAFEEVFGATKDLKFTKEMMEAIGMAATATNEEVKTVATIAQQMQRKFGLSAAEAKEALAQVYEQAQQGGPNFEAFAQVIDVVGAKLITAGLEGKRALEFLSGAMNATDAQMGGLGRQVSGIQNMLVKLGSPNTLKTMAKIAGIDASKLLNEKDFLARMRVMLSRGKKGMEALQTAFIGPEEKDALRILFTEPFEEALQRAKAGGLRGKEATEQALRSLDESIAQFGKTSLNAAALQEEAAKKATEPQARLRVALENLNQAFASPEILTAMEDLSAALPEIAKLFGNFVSFAAKNPVLAGTLGLGGVAAKGFLTSMMASIVSGHATGATGAAATIAQAHVVGGMKVGNLIKGAGALAAVAIAGALAAEKISKDADENAKSTGGISVARAKLAGRSKSLSKERAEARFAEKAIAAKEKELGSFSNSLFLSDDQRRMEETELAKAREDLKWKKAHIDKLEKAQAAGTPATPTPTAPQPTEQPVTRPGKKQQVNLDDQSARAIAQAVRSAMGGTTLRVAFANPGSRGAAGNADPGPGTRGPMAMGPSQALGGY